MSDWDFQFLWLVAAWAACVPAVLGYLLLRGKIGDHYRADNEKKHVVRAQIGLSLAVAVLAVPGLVCFWAAWRLENATVCTSEANRAGSTFVVDGLLVGETGDRVYVGDTTARTPSIVSIPQSKVTRTVIGGATRATADCPAKPTTS